MPPKLLVSVQHGIKRIVINRPERRNAIDLETAQLLHDAFTDPVEDDARVVVLTGAGESFCAGADLQAVGSMEELSRFDVTRSLRETTNPTILAMRALPMPIIARVHGPAVGVGCNFALAADIIIASEAASFGQVFVKIGLMPDGGSSWFLPRLVGYAKAFELMATGDIVSANDALALGLINRVVPTPALDGAVESMATRLARGPARALANLKAALDHGQRSDLAAALDFEALHQGDCFRSPDFAEGVSAFLQKRAPQYGDAPPRS